MHYHNEKLKLQANNVPASCVAQPSFSLLLLLPIHFAGLL